MVSQRHKESCVPCRRRNQFPIMPVCSRAPILFTRPNNNLGTLHGRRRVVLRVGSTSGYLSPVNFKRHHARLVPGNRRHQLRHRFLSSCLDILLNKQSFVKMSLPVIRSLADCTDIYKTVLPYVPQLHDLPQQIFENITNLQALKVLYISTNPLIFAFAFSLFLGPVFLIVSEVNKNYSQVDRCWSLLPTVYNAHFALYAHAAGLPTRRLDTLLVFSGLWSVSLLVYRRIINSADCIRRA